MLRYMFAFVSALMLTATFATTVVADSHLPAAPPAGTTAGTAAGTTVTAVPSTGVGFMAEQAPDLLVLGMVGIACLLALLALTVRNWQRA
ncbi:MAG: hypothetical protein ACRDJC_21690 [Thermomicrobiales bacterium]